MIGLDGLWLKEHLKQQGIFTQYITTPTPNDNATPSGRAIIQVSTTDGENAIILEPGANGYVDSSSVKELENMMNSTEFSILVLQNEVRLSAQMLEIAVRLRKDRILTVFNPAPYTVGIADVFKVLKNVDIIIVNEGEMASFAKDLKISEPVTKDNIDSVSRKILTLKEKDSSQRLRMIITTLGSEGVSAAFYDCNNKIQTLRESAYKNVQIVDTTGAGDTFVGYFVAMFVKTGCHENYKCWERGRIQEVLRTANIAAALACTKEGAMTAPDIKEVEKFMD